MNVFLGGLSADMTEEKLREHIEQVLHIEPTEITINRRNEYNCSFKVTIKNTDKPTFFSPEYWDEGIIIKPFRERKTHPPTVSNSRTNANHQVPYWQRWSANRDRPFTSRWDQPNQRLTYDTNQNHGFILV